MRLHRNLVYTTIDSLNAIFNEGEYADKVVARALKKDKRWGSSDRKFVAETIYEVVRWKRLYAEIAEVKEPFDRDNLWRMFSVWAVLRGYPIPDWRQLAGRCQRVATAAHAGRAEYGASILGRQFEVRVVP